MAEREAGIYREALAEAETLSNGADIFLVFNLVGTGRMRPCSALARSGVAELRVELFEEIAGRVGDDRARREDGRGARFV